MITKSAPAAAAAAICTASSKSRQPQVNAWRIRLVYYLRLGNTEKAQQCKKQVELLQIQNSPTQHLEGMNENHELLAYALADDLIPVRVDDDSVWVPVDNSASDSDGVEDSRQLRRLFFLRRAEGESLQIREIPGRREVFAALTRHGYGNLPVAGLWTFQALVFERLARSTRAFELGLPEGIGPLRTAVSELLEHGSLVGR